MYTKNPTWSASEPITYKKLNNLESQYDLAYTTYELHAHSNIYSKSEMESTFWYDGNDGSGSGSDADLIYKSTGNLHLASFSNLGIPSKLIVMWSGSYTNIPSGWYLCDGNNGTPDLKDRFVVGAGNTYTYGNTGGSNTFKATGTITVDAHVLTESELPEHSHTYTEKARVNYDWLFQDGFVEQYSQDINSNITTSSAGSGSGHTHSTGEGTKMDGNNVNGMPFFYALAFIQKQ